MIVEFSAQASGPKFYRPMCVPFFFFEHSSPLLEEKRDVVSQAVIVDFSYPVRFHRSCARSGRLVKTWKVCREASFITLKTDSIKSVGTDLWNRSDYGINKNQTRFAPLKRLGQC